MENRVPQPNDENLIWIDLEMTGLDPDTCVILEIATIITDKHLNILAEGPVMAIHQTDAILDGMDTWCTQTHGASGLTQRCRESRYSVADAEQATLAFVQQWVGPGQSPLCGNSIGQDRRFMVAYMPALEAFCHYRNIDVSTIKELTRRWAPDIAAGHVKRGVHLALDDIRESIAELVYYRQQVFTI